MTDQDIQQALDLLQEALCDCKGYLLFGSAALYLHAKTYGIEELDMTPHDIDIAVFDMESMKHVRDQLVCVPSVKFDHEGVFQSCETDDALRLSGMIGKMPFECFLHSLVMPDHAEEYRTEIRGLRTLNVEGLRKQYAKCVEFEKRLSKNHLCKKSKLPARLTCIEILTHLERIEL